MPFLATTGSSSHTYFPFLFITIFITPLCPNFKTSIPNTWKEKNVCFWHFTIFISFPSFKDLLKYNIFPKISVTGIEALIPHTHPSTYEYYPHILYTCTVPLPSFADSVNTLVVEFIHLFLFMCSCHCFFTHSLGHRLGL